MLIVFNPAAGRRRMGALHQLLDILSINGVRIELFETRAAGDAEERTRQAVREGAPMVVAAGGDGTIAEVANGLIGSPTALGVVPLGTANVLARELALPFRPRAIAEALAFGRTRPHWPGVAAGPGGPRVFVQMVGAGFDAQVVHNMPSWLKRLLGRTAYGIQSGRELFRYPYNPVRLRLDGREHEASSVIVCKGRLYAGNYLAAPSARPSEPGFSVLLFNRTGAWATMRHGLELLSGRWPAAPGITHLRASQVELFGNELVPVQADGDGAGFTPITIRDAAAPLRIVINGTG